MWKIVVMGVCLCVFLFGLHAKLAQYQAPSPSATAVSSAKLWVGDNRLEAQSLLGLTELLALAVALQFQQLLAEVTFPLPLWAIPVPVPLSRLSHLRRFFRPPPAR